MADLVELRRALQEERHADLEARVRRLLAPLDGAERALDAGCGTGALAYALAPSVGEVVGVDASEAYVATARKHAPPGCAFVVGDVAALDFPYGDFDLVGCLRVLHHVRRPELVVSELCTFMRTRPAQFDAVISADTLVYFGALAEAMGAAKHCLKPGGWLTFTVEALPREDEDHVIQHHGRYAHSERYVRQCLFRAGFADPSIDRVILRKEMGKDVHGLAVLARAR